MKKFIALAAVLLPCLATLGQIDIQPAGPVITNGSILNIRWTPPPGVGTVRILLQVDDYRGAYIYEYATNSGQYSWTVGQIFDYNYYNRFFIAISGFSGGDYFSWRTAYFYVIGDPGALPIILSPTSNQVVYVGDNLEIKWKPLVAGHGASNVVISVTGDVGGSYFGQSAPNTGSFTWTNVSKNGANQEGFTLSVTDGAATTNHASVKIRIPNVPRPRPVIVSIRQVVSVEWVSIPDHTYQVESSPDLQNWSVIAEGQAEDTNSAALFYTDTANRFFRVFDLTP